MVTAIKLDDVAKAMGTVVSDFTDDPVGFTINFGVEFVNEKVNELMNCYKGLYGKAQKCSELNTLKACASTAATALSAAKVANKAAMSAANIKRLESGLSKVDNVLSVTTDMCKFGCEGGVCGDANGNAALTLNYSVPDGCVCRDLEVINEGGSTDVTPTECGRNFYTQTGKAEFTYMGCYVGVTDDPSTYSE
ncbi:uncharacterized protein IUM83_10725 [Phytophthora cinnamomi]|uniref:uncharacterized protein n=1 Tax=Phytophthora cinnamomi TaxID=4785 RepID=UPI00355A3474|nr:hypothetical protein IUM83_10725 [Phytophthora cinnamomi]